MTARLAHTESSDVACESFWDKMRKGDEWGNAKERLLLPLYLEVWSRVNSRGRCVADNLPFGETARCKYAVQMPIEGTIDGANGRSRHKGHCRAVVAAATMGAVCS